MCRSNREDIQQAVRAIPPNNGNDSPMQDYRMSVALDRVTSENPEVAVISVRLARWYDAHPSIRRLWAIEEDSLLAVYVSLEPTSDGDDCLPVWLAMNHHWRRDLQSITRREVHLRFVPSDVLPTSYVNGDAMIIAEVDWRESWIYA
jgi:hypothetical protein